MLARALDALVADAPAEARLAGLLELLARTVGARRAAVLSAGPERRVAVAIGADEDDPMLACSRPGSTQRRPDHGRIAQRPVERSSRSPGEMTRRPVESDPDGAEPAVSSGDRDARRRRDRALGHRSRRHPSAAARGAIRAHRDPERAVGGPRLRDDRRGRRPGARRPPATDPRPACRRRPRAGHRAAGAGRRAPGAPCPRDRAGAVRVDGRSRPADSADRSERLSRPDRRGPRRGPGGRARVHRAEPAASSTPWASSSATCSRSRGSSPATSVSIFGRSRWPRSAAGSMGSLAPLALERRIDLRSDLPPRMRAATSAIGARSSRS